MTISVVIMEENQQPVSDNEGKVPILELNSENDENPLPGDIKGEIQDGMIDAKYLSRAKLGEGLSFASIIFGIFAMIFSSFAFLSGGELAFITIPWAIAAMLAGVVGNNYQRLISTKFGYGVAGAVLGLTALIATITMGFMAWG